MRDKAIDLTKPRGAGRQSEAIVQMVWRLPSLHVAEKTLYECLYKHDAGDFRGVTVDDQHLADDLGWSPRQVRKWRARLLNRGLIFSAKTAGEVRYYLSDLCIPGDQDNPV